MSWLSIAGGGLMTLVLLVLTTAVWVVTRLFPAAPADDCAPPSGTGQHDDERRTAPSAVALGRDRAAVGLDEGPADREPDA